MNIITQLFGKRKRFFNLFKGRRRRKESRKLLSEEDIHNLFFQWNNVLVSGDATAVASLYAKDAVLIATSSNERKMDFASIKGYFDPVVKRNPSVIILNRTVKIGQDFAMDVGIYEWTFGDDGSKKQARFTFVYVPNENGTWEIAHHHSSALPQQYIHSNVKDDAGPRFVDDEQTYGTGGKYHDGSAAYPQLLEDGSCAKPLQGACASRDTKKTAYLEGPIDCGGNGCIFRRCWHCHGSSADSTYYWWIRDHWFRQYNGRVRCCCGWYEGGCDYRRLVTETEDVNECRDANEDHYIGCNPQYQASQLDKPIPEDDNVCWEIQRFGFTEEGGSPPAQSPDGESPVLSPTTAAPIESSITDTPIGNPTTVAPIASPTTEAPVASPNNEEEEEEESDCVDSPLDFIVGKRVRSCSWAGNGNSATRCAKPGVAQHCPVTCRKFDEFICADSGRKFVLEENGRKKKCGFFASNPERCELYEFAFETCRRLVPTVIKTSKRIDYA